MMTGEKPQFTHETAPASASKLIWDPMPRQTHSANDRSLLLGRSSIFFLIKKKPSTWYKGKVDYLRDWFNSRSCCFSSSGIPSSDATKNTRSALITVHKHWPSQKKEPGSLVQEISEKWTSVLFLIQGEMLSLAGFKEDFAFLGVKKGWLKASCISTVYELKNDATEIGWSGGFGFSSVF